MKVLAIGAHYDDVELGCGGTLLRHRDCKDEISIFVITKSDYVSLGHVRTAEVAREEGKKTANILTANLYEGNFETLTLIATKELVNTIIEVVTKVNPDIVYTHFVGDQHTDHQAVAKATLIATKRVKKVCAYISNVHDTFPKFAHNYCVDISGVFKKKLELLNCFESEKETHLTWEKQLHYLNGLFGLKNNVEFAEPFEIIRLFE